MGIAGVLLLFLVLLPLYVLATNISVSVLDGDTIEALHKIRAERIRLKGIDCPENGQAYSKRAKQALSKIDFA
jgi:micrococcal nuclease